MDYLDEASPNYSAEDPRPCRAGVKCNFWKQGWLQWQSVHGQVRTPLSNPARMRFILWRFLQAQIPLQRQQLRISEDQPMGGKTGKNTDCQASLNGECTLAGSSPVRRQGSVNTMTLDSLMTEQHATWYVPGNKALIEDPSNDKCLGFWDRARGQEDNKEGKLHWLAVRRWWIGVFMDCWVYFDGLMVE